MIKIVTVEEMRAIERATDAAGISYAKMMQHAGRAVAEVIKDLLGEVTLGRRIAVLVGPGNNGGDGLVAARILKEETEAEVGCYLLKARSEDDQVFVAARDAGVFVAVAEDDQRWRVLKNLVGNADIVVDALLGTGARLPVEGDLKKLVKVISNSLRYVSSDEDTHGDLLTWPASSAYGGGRETIVVAVDCPSGLDCDTGELDAVSIPADVTVTFAAVKWGQVNFPGAAAVGDLVVADIGTPDHLKELQAVKAVLVTGTGVGGRLPERPRNAHKGTFGRAMIIAGSVNYTGAAALAGEAAYRAGAGLVTLAVPQAVYPVLAAHLLETTWLLLPHDMGVLNEGALGVFAEEAGEFDALLVGPGLGCEDETATFMRGLLAGGEQIRRGTIGFVAREQGNAAPSASGYTLPAALVIDADGLNLLTRIEKWWEFLPPQTVLTPHPGEMARLTGIEREVILENRVSIAAEKAAEWDCIVVLKGAFTAIALPDGQVFIIPFATDALATAGTGDVLAGCIAGLMAQGVASSNAAIAGAYVHALAGQIAKDELGTARSVMARDVLDSLPKAFASIIRSGG